MLFGGVRVRVSGGHLCEAEAPTEPTGETTPPYENALVTFFMILRVVEDADPYDSVVEIL